MPFMDDQQTYLLNGLLTRQFSLGRIVRFRKVARGRQATTYELLTAEQNEYLVYLYSPTYEATTLETMAVTVGVLDENRFSVMPMVRGREGAYVAEGPQGTHLMASLALLGSEMAPDQFTEHDVTQIGLRLAWMHRLLLEQLAAPVRAVPLDERLDAALASKDDLPREALPELSEGEVKRLRELLRLPTEQAWVHGDMQLAALLVDGDHQIRTVTDWALLHWGSPGEDLLDIFLALCVLPGGRVDEVRGQALLESYDSLRPIRRMAWTPVIASWLAQRFLDAATGRRAMPAGFTRILASTEDMASVMAACTPR